MMLAYLLQQITGRDVFVIQAYKADTGIGDWNPALTNNMFDYMNTAITEAFADLNAGTNGAPYSYVTQFGAPLVYADYWIWEGGATDAINAYQAALGDGSVVTPDPNNPQGLNPVAYANYRDSFLTLVDAWQNDPSAGWMHPYYTDIFQVEYAHYEGNADPAVGGAWNLYALLSWDGHAYVDRATNERVRTIRTRGIPLDTTNGGNSFVSVHFTWDGLQQISDNIAYAITQGRTPKTNSYKGLGDATDDTAGFFGATVNALGNKIVNISGMDIMAPTTISTLPSPTTKGLLDLRSDITITAANCLVPSVISFESTYTWDFAPLFLGSGTLFSARPTMIKETGTGSMSFPGFAAYTESVVYISNSVSGTPGAGDIVL
jgi:hypothetical protein